MDDLLMEFLELLTKGSKQFTSDLGLQAKQNKHKNKPKHRIIAGMHKRLTYVFLETLVELLVGVRNLYENMACGQRQTC